jgi:hypothetical protein
LGGLLGRAQIDYFVSGVTLLSEGQHVALDIPEFSLDRRYTISRRSGSSAVARLRHFSSQRTNCLPISGFTSRTSPNKVAADDRPSMSALDVALKALKETIFFRSVWLPAQLFKLSGKERPSQPHQIFE